MRSESILRLAFLRLLTRSVGVIVLSQLLAAAAFAQAFVPDSDSTVIEILPDAVVALSREARMRERGSSTLSAGSTAAAASEADIRPAGANEDLLRQALTAYQIAATEQDPRAYGHTLAVLERWPEERPKPALIHILTAAVLQHTHDFQRALTELDRALLIEPANPQAHLMKAQISLVTADYAAAARSCEALRFLTRPDIGLNCQAQLRSLTGGAAASLDAVRTRLGQNTAIDRQDSLELHITAAGIAHRLGHESQAEQYYRSALQMAPGSPYVLVNYGTLLLEMERPGDLLSLLQQKPSGTLGTELKILKAEALLAFAPEDAGLTELLAELEAFFQTAFLRAEAPHKEYARYALNILQDPVLALESARLNWQLQKEPSDTLLLAQAAHASGNTKLLKDVAGWVASVGTEDSRLTVLLAQDGAEQNMKENP